MFATGPLAAVLTSTPIFYPVTRIYGKWHWAVPLAAGALVLVTQYDGLTMTTTHGLTATVMIFELACLVLLVPLLVAVGIRFNKGENI